MTDGMTMGWLGMRSDETLSTYSSLEFKYLVTDLLRNLGGPEPDSRCKYVVLPGQLSCVLAKSNRFDLPGNVVLLFAGTYTDHPNQQVAFALFVAFLSSFGTSRLLPPRVIHVIIIPKSSVHGGLV